MPTLFSGDRVGRDRLQAARTRQEKSCIGATNASESLIYDDQDRIDTYGSLGFTWTLNGEVATKEDSATSEVTSYSYDALGNLIGVTLPNGDDIEYLVDGFGRRVGKRRNGVLERGWLWRGQLQPIAELDASGAVVKRFVYAEGVNVPDLMVTSSATYRLIRDHLGSVRLVVDQATGAVAQEIVYDAWGRVLSDSNPGFQPFGFAGGLYDPDTGLVRFGARDYDAEIARWTAKDPIRFDGGDPNVFAYAYGDPINFRDALGLYGDTGGGEGGPGSFEPPSDDGGGGSGCDDCSSGAGGGWLGAILSNLNPLGAGGCSHNCLEPAACQNEKNACLTGVERRGFTSVCRDCCEQEYQRCLGCGNYGKNDPRGAVEFKRCYDTIPQCN